jgi:hypothetical protein
MFFSSTVRHFGDARNATPDRNKKATRHRLRKVGKAEGQGKMW